MHDNSSLIGVGINEQHVIRFGFFFIDMNDYII